MRITGVIIMLVLLVSCQGPNEILEEVANPDKQFKVILFQQPGGITTQNSRHVSILKTEQPLSADQDGNVFIFDSGNNRNAFSQPFEIKWEDSKSIRISYSDQIYVIRKETEYRDFRITYEVLR